MKSSRQIRIALAGNPNSGKTSIFNAITGARRHVGNYPGVTVEKKEGLCRYGEHEIHVVDLPGTYSLTAYSMEEIVARDYLIDDKPDAVVCVIDASNLERNLYLALQLKELGIPLVLSFNMIDVARSRGLDIDLKRMSQLLEVPVVPTVGHKGHGIQQLLETTVATATGSNGRQNIFTDYGKEIEDRIALVSRKLEEQYGDLPDHRRRWISLKILENDKNIRVRYNSPGVRETANESITQLEALYGEEPEIIVAEGRYNLIAAVCRRAVRGPLVERRTKTDRIDAVVTHRLLGLPIFLGLMYLVFQLTFTLGQPLMDGIEMGFGRLTSVVTSAWPPGSAVVLKSLVVDGVIGGVGGVIVFLPNILLLFLVISLLESSGYMARAAFIMDRLMHTIGLHGKSFIPMLVGFGCSVPAIMATRTLASHRDRLTTMLIIPLISCSARLPIYLLIIPAFFPQAWRAPTLWFVYIIGIVLAVAGAKVLRITLFKGESSPFLMELPPYKVPTVKASLIQMWERGRLFLRKAGTLILGVSIIMWALTTFPKQRDFPGDAGATPEAAALQLEHSFAGRIGRAMEPVIKPMGFDWKVGTALIGAFAAKEVFVAQMGIVYSVGDVEGDAATLRDKLAGSYSRLAAFCIMLFALISSPCVATVAVTRRESNTWRWALFQFAGLTVLGYVVTVLVYQVFSRLGVGG